MQRMAEVKGYRCCEKHLDADEDLRDVSGIDGVRDGRARMCFRRGRRWRERNSVVLLDWNMKDEVEEHGTTSGEENDGEFGGAQG